MLVVTFALVVDAQEAERAEAIDAIARLEEWSRTHVDGDPTASD